MSSSDQDHPGLSRREIDGCDFAAEVASGGDGARMSRFLVSDRSPVEIKRKEEERKAEQLSVLLHMIATAEQVTAVQQSLYQLQDRLDQAFAELEEKREDLDDRTVRLEDGTAVYRLADGRFTTADGQIVDISDLPTVIPDNVATYEEWLELMRRADQLAGIQTDVIDKGHETLNKDGVTVGELEDLERDIRGAEAIIDQRPDEAVQPDTPSQAPAENPASLAPNF